MTPCTLHMDYYEQIKQQQHFTCEVPHVLPVVLVIMTGAEMIMLMKALMLTLIISYWESSNVLQLLLVTTS